MKAIRFGGLDLCPHPCVPAGEMWLIECQGLVYLHPDTFERIRLLIWAKRQTDAVTSRVPDINVTQGQVLAMLAQLRKGTAP